MKEAILLVKFMYLTNRDTVRRYTVREILMHLTNLNTERSYYVRYIFNVFNHLDRCKKLWSGKF